MPRLLSVNVGLPQDVAWRGKTVHTGIWKTPVQGRRMVRRLNIDGDGQGDLAGHGGEHRAVFVYQIESYRYWQAQLARSDFSYGQFGENFTVDGLADGGVYIGDRYRIGSAVFEVTQPRVTCYRVGIRMNEPQMAALLVSHGRPGFYFRVIEEGEVEAGDEIVQVTAGPERMTVVADQCAVVHARSSREPARAGVTDPGLERRLAHLLPGSARSGAERERDDGQPCAHPSGRPATGLDRFPRIAGVAQGPRERQRDFAGARADGWAPSGGRVARAVRRAAAEAGTRCARAAAQLFAVGRATR